MQRRLGTIKSMVGLPQHLPVALREGPRALQGKLRIISTPPRLARTRRGTLSILAVLLVAHLGPLRELRPARDGCRGLVRFVTHFSCAIVVRRGLSGF